MNDALAPLGVEITELPMTPQRVLAALLARATDEGCGVRRMRVRRACADAISLLAGEAGARVLAGGQSLGPMLNLRLAQPRLAGAGEPHLPELTGVAADADAVTIGACVTHAAIADGLVPDIGGGVLARVAEASRIARCAIAARSAAACVMPIPRRTG